MLHLLSVIGARPQIIKAAAVSRAITQKFSGRIRETIVHTGQHYDEEMSQVFFDELGIPQPAHNLEVGSDTHGKQTARMIEGMESLMLDERPDGVVLYGDTNSTLAGAIVASKLGIPVVHIEAGMRSYNKKMPEEINRILCDHVSTLLFSPTANGIENLVKEGFRKDTIPPFSADNPAIFHCGDVMFDNSMHFSPVADAKTDIISRLDLHKSRFILVTIHRNNNTDDPQRLTALFSAINGIIDEFAYDVVLPLHPRTQKLLETNVKPEVYARVKDNPRFRILPPLPFLEMIALEKNCRIVMTDSGGLQKEAYFFKKPCIVLRSETEWVELVEGGTAIVADADELRIRKAFQALAGKADMRFPKIYGDGHAAEFICGEMLKHLGK
jgi:UDP-GlcNAc3NAcA epimerase